MLWYCESAWLGGEESTADVVIDVQDGTIVSVTTGAGCPSGASRLRGLVLPGLVNAHSHSFHRALRGRTHRTGGDFWAWRRLMYDVSTRLDPDNYRALALATFAEMSMAGVTCVGEFHYVHHQPGGRPYEDPNEMGCAVAEAAATVGIRLTLLDVCYLRGDVDGSALAPEQQRFSDGSVEGWLERVAAIPEGPRVRVGAAPHSVRAVGQRDLTAMATWAHENGRPVHVHVSEQPAENEACLAATGRTPTQILADAGALTAMTTVVHATHVTDEDTALLGRAPTAVCLCPTTERDLADGVGPAGAFASAGSPLCVGSDSQAVIDLFEELRAIELDERLVTGRRGLLAPATLLAAGTVAGSTALGWGRHGLVAGARADFIAIDLDSVRLAGTRPADAAAHAVYAASASDVTDVVVAGRRIVEGREHLLVADVGGHLARAIAAVS
jgi:formiminoglutamate deiminase